MKVRLYNIHKTMKQVLVLGKVIIIGGGILGASTAFHLAKSGKDVLLIDRKEKGQATDAAAGIICPWISQRRNKAWYALAKGGAAYYADLIEQLKEEGETETGYRKVGAISLHKEALKLEKMVERALERRVDAPEIGKVLRLDANETKAAFPPLSADFSSVHVEGAARVDGRALRDALLRAAKKNGAVVKYGSAKLSVNGEKIDGVTVDDEFHHASKVIITVGAWAGELLKPLGIDPQVTGQKAQIIHLKLGQKTSDWPVVMPPTDQYILAFDEGEIVIGATHEDDEKLELNPTAGGMHEVFQKALEVAPGLNEAMFDEVRVGVRPFTPGFLPVIGEVPGHPQLLFANGLGASGLTVGPFLGKQLANMALDKEVEIDLSLYPVENAFKPL